jgi:hypothetical protein
MHRGATLAPLTPGTWLLTPLALRTVERNGDATALGGSNFLFEIRDNVVRVPHRHHRFSPLSEPGSYRAFPTGCALAIKGRDHSQNCADCGYLLIRNAARS